MPSITEYWQKLESDIPKGINPFQKYAPRGKQVECLASTLPEIAISGPAGTGKSRACLEKLNYLCLSYPGTRALIARKTRTSLSETGLQTFEQFVLGLDHPMVVNGPQRRNRQVYLYDNGSQINTGGMDKPERILSSEYDIIYVQQAEELDENDWEFLLTRLRGTALPFRQILGDCNPGAPTHWLKQRADTALDLLDSRHEDNPLLHDGEDWTPFGLEYIATLDRLTGARKLRLRFGRWAQAEGIVYENWDSTIHLIDRFDIPADWRRFRSVDFGFSNPFVCQWWAVDGDGRMYLYREIYHTKRTVKVHSGDIKEHSVGERIGTTVCDHDAEDMATLRENGISVKSAKKAVSVGIQKVIERLKMQEDSKPRLFVLRDSRIKLDPELEQDKKPTCTVDEFDVYVWNDKRTKDEPVKENDHGMDALRYAVMHEDAGKSLLIGVV